MTTDAAQRARGAAFAPLRRPAFRMLFLAQFVSNIGTWMQGVGAQWFLVERAHNDSMVAWTQTADTLPVLLLALLAGVTADLVNRRTLLMTTSLVSTAIALVLTVVTLADRLDPWALLGFTFLLGCSAAITGPAWQAIQPELVPREELTQASALGSITVNGARAVGPAVAGVLVAAAGPGVVFALNTVSFLAVTAALVVWRRERRPDSAVREHVLSGLASGLRYARAAPGVRRILLRCALFAFPASALLALLPSAAHSLMGTGAGGYSALLALLGAGAIVGTLTIGTIRDHLSRTVMLTCSAAVFAVATLCAAWLPLWPMLVVMLIAGVAWMVQLTTLNVAMQLSLPGWVRARGLSMYLLVFMGSQAVGSFLWGLVVPHLGLRATLTTAAVLLALVALSVLLIPVRARSGTLDRGVVPLSSGLPELQLEAVDTAPVVVRISYRVAPENVDAFRTAMREVQRSRRRTGASRWRLLRPSDAPTTFIEEFLVPSWNEHELQHTVRWTGYDAELYRRATALAEEQPVVEHLVVSEA
ncbi:MFS transporter [Nocardioides sp. DS6]|uniref:MFS transporter n=1 Tax=Nocardioides eburneus TaxID=3231482 RepID=A0ABV3SZ85_9ACTN